MEVPYLLHTQKDTKAISSPEALKQNIFGVRVIAWSTAFVGLGIAILGYIAENGKIALIVGVVIVLIVAAVLIKQYLKTTKQAAFNITQ
jgi:hypothetical protein